MIPLDGNISRISRRAEEFKELHESLQRNLQTYLPLTMDLLATMHQKVKSSNVADATRQMVCDYLHRRICLFNTELILPPDSEWNPQKITISHDVWWLVEVLHVP